MKPKKRKGPKKQARARRTGPRRFTVPLLILECDTAKLEPISASLGKEMAEFLTKIGAQDSYTLVRAATKGQLQNDLAALVLSGKVYKTIWVIGHSSANGIQMTSDFFSPWPGFACWLRDFRPMTIVLTACAAGQCWPAKSMFAGIETLHKLYGSPVKLTVEQARLIQAIVVGRLMELKVDANARMLLKTVFSLCTGGVLFEYSRAEFRRLGPGEQAMWDLAGIGLGELLKGMRR